MIDPEALFVAASQPKIVDRFAIPPRRERLLKAPKRYRTGRTGDWLRASNGSDQLWSHQALGLDVLARGANLVLATATASGKSKVFQIAAMDEILNGDGAILCFYPQKALGSDQRKRWERCVETAGLPSTTVGEITGDVPMAERAHVLDNGRIILATPDAWHCWFMPLAGTPAGQTFLRRLRYIVIDEAHALEGVFGSGFAMFFPMLDAMKRRACADGGAPLQVIAATATIANPVAHLTALTGLPFEAVTDDDNGAPFHGLSVLHVEGPECGSPAEKAAADMLRPLADHMPREAAFIAFVDSRQGVERVQRLIDHSGVKGYRGGYNQAERRAIERSLRHGELRGTVSTSALELGIDIPQFVIGFNMGIPTTRKAFRQRVGRAGRACAGTFVVMAPLSAFAMLGTSLHEFYAGAVEPSPLYLDNRCILFEAACCYRRLTASGDGEAALDEGIEWPAGFKAALAWAAPGAKRPADLDHLASIGADNPHLAFPLRKIAGVTYALKNRRTGDLIGTIQQDKALREAYPGGTYFHAGVPHRVVEWRTNSYENSILLDPVRRAEPTQPMLRSLVSVSNEASEVIDGRLLAGESGSLAEIRMRVVESVEGYRCNNVPFAYRDLIQEDRRKSRKQREFSTTGIALRIAEGWFSGSDDHQVAVRRAVGRAFVTLLTSEYGIASGDVRAVHTGVAVHGPAGVKKVDDAIAFFDDVPGGLRLSAPLFKDFGALLDRLAKAAALAGTEALLSAATVELLQAWHGSLRPATASASCEIDPGEDNLLVFAPNSRVAFNFRGTLVERELIEPQFIATGDGETLMYRFETAPGVQGWVAHDQVKPVGHDWRRAIWNPFTNVIEEIAA